MSRDWKISLLACGALAAAVAPLPAPAQEQLGRLFFTPAQRASLDIARSQRARAAVATEKAEQDATPVPQTITYNGVLRRSDGKTTVWINNQPVHDRESAGAAAIVGRVRPDGSVTLQVPQSGRSVNLKPGQSVELLSGNVEEGYSRRLEAPKPEPKPAAKPGATAGTAKPPVSRPRRGAGTRGARGAASGRLHLPGADGDGKRPARRRADPGGSSATVTPMPFGSRRTYPARRRSQRGQAMMLMLVGLFGLATALLVYAMTDTTSLALRRDRDTAATMAEVKRALIGWSVQRTPSGSLPNARPGEFPCPDMNNDGLEDGTCVAGAIGRVPWKSLGIPEPKDADGETLWYAIAGPFRIWNVNSDPIHSDTKGNITVYQDSTASVITSEAIAVLFAPGTALGVQNRDSVATALCPTTGTTIARNLCAANFSGNRRNRQQFHHQRALHIGAELGHLQRQSHGNHDG